MMIKDEGPSTKLILVLELLDVFPASWELDLWGGAWNPTESAILLFSLTFCHSAREPESIVPLNITILNQPACLTIHQRGLPCALQGGGVVPGIIQNGSYGLCGGLQPLQGVYGELPYENQGTPWPGWSLSQLKIIWHNIRSERKTRQPDLHDKYHT